MKSSCCYFSLIELLSSCPDPPAFFLSRSGLLLVVFLPNDSGSRDGKLTGIPRHISRMTTLISLFNLFRRARKILLVRAVRQRCPKASAWAESCYNNSSHLFFGKTRIASSSGTQQGDPLAGPMSLSCCNCLSHNVSLS